MNMKNGLICLSTVAIIVFCTLNVTTATTGNYSATFHNNAGQTVDRIQIARSNPSTGILHWNYITKHVSASSAAHNGIVYIGSCDHNVYALRRKRDKNMELHDR